MTYSCVCHAMKQGVAANNFMGFSLCLLSVRSVPLRRFACVRVCVGRGGQGGQIISVCRVSVRSITVAQVCVHGVFFFGGRSQGSVRHMSYTKIVPLRIRMSRGAHIF